MAFTPAIPIEEQTYDKLHFDGSDEHAQLLIPRITELLDQGKIWYADMQGRGEPWRMTFQRRDDTPEQVAMPGMWIVFSSLGVIRALSDADYLAEFEPDGS